MGRGVIGKLIIDRLIIILLISVHFLILNTSAASAARLPSVGSDSNAWGNLLNEFLLISHTANGTLIKGLNASFDTLFFGIMPHSS